MITKNLESKIMTCSTLDYIVINNLKNSDLKLTGVHLSTKLNTQSTEILAEKLYSALAQLIDKESYLAVTNVQITQVYYNEQGTHKVEGTIYGTGIKEKSL